MTVANTSRAFMPIGRHLTNGMSGWTSPETVCLSKYQEDHSYVSEMMAVSI